MRKGQFEDISGKRFGRLVAVERIGQISGKSSWRCICDCGNECVVSISNLKNGHTRSCGCYALERTRQAKTIHGGRKKEQTERLYRVWRSMRQRCYLESNPHYCDYGGRGITVCSEWNVYAIFRDWALEAGYDPNAKRGACTIDRIDVNGNYEPSNCRWADMSVQRRNTRTKEQIINDRTRYFQQRGGFER